MLLLFAVHVRTRSYQLLEFNFQLRQGLVLVFLDSQRDFIVALLPRLPLFLLESALRTRRVPALRLHLLFTGREHLLDGVEGLDVDLEVGSFACD